MKHAKRMALVPEEMLDRFERKQKLETSPITSDLLRSDIRLSDILEHSDLDDAEKQKLYNASMERYLELRRQKDSQVPTVRFVPIKEEEKQSNPLFKIMINTRQSRCLITGFARVCTEKTQTLIFHNIIKEHYFSIIFLLY